MPAPTTMPTMIAIASMRPSSGWGASVLVVPAAVCIGRLLLAAGHLRRPALRAQIAAERIARHGHACGAEVVLAVDEAERQLVALQRGTEDRLRLAPDGHRSADTLVALDQRDAALGRVPRLLLEHPRAFDVRGHVPQVGVAELDAVLLVRVPVAHVELVRGHPRARLHLEDRRA